MEEKKIFVEAKKGGSDTTNQGKKNLQEVSQTTSNKLADQGSFFEDGCRLFIKDHLYQYLEEKKFQEKKRIIRYLKLTFAGDEYLTELENDQTEVLKCFLKQETFFIGLSKISKDHDNFFIHFVDWKENFRIIVKSESDDLEEKELKKNPTLPDEPKSNFEFNKKIDLYYKNNHYIKENSYGRIAILKNNKFELRIKISTQETEVLSIEKCETEYDGLYQVIKETNIANQFVTALYEIVGEKNFKVIYHKPDDNQLLLGTYVLLNCKKSMDQITKNGISQNRKIKTVLESLRKIKVSFEVFLCDSDMNTTIKPLFPKDCLMIWLEYASMARSVDENSKAIFKLTKIVDQRLEDIADRFKNIDLHIEDRFKNIDNLHIEDRFKNIDLQFQKLFQLLSGNSPPKQTKLIKFQWKHGGRKVNLIGSWDNWTQRIPMKSNDGIIYETIYPLSPGLYEYLFERNDTERVIDTHQNYIAQKCNWINVTE